LNTPDNNHKLKLWWTEEQELFQKLYNAIFTINSPVEVTGTTAFLNIESINIQQTSEKPEVLLFGCNLISHETIKILTQLKKANPNLAILILAASLKYEELPHIRQYLSTQKSSFGFVFKRSLNSSEQLFSALSMVKNSQIVIDTRLASLLSTENDKSLSSSGLTTREMEILNLVARGYTNIAISETLCIEVKTVRHHINNMYSKLKATSEFDNRHPRVSATNIYLKLTGQLTFDDRSKMD
jgi:DNA-binding NarL/FixJ family response regulator